MTILITLLGFARAVPMKVWLLVAGCVVVIIGVLAFAHYERSIGATSALDTINKANEQSEKAADQGASNVEDCYKVNGTWDRGTGTCIKH